MILDSVIAIVDLPAPVRPQIPIFYPCSILNVRFLSTISVFGLYLSDTLLNSMLPFTGHSFDGRGSPSTLSDGIYEIFINA